MAASSDGTPPIAITKHEKLNVLGKNVFRPEVLERQLQ
jgi:hypothetical protein